MDKNLSVKKKKEKENEAPHSFLAVCVHDSSYSFLFPLILPKDETVTSFLLNINPFLIQFLLLLRGLMQQRLCSMHIFQPKALENTYAKSSLYVCTPTLFVLICHHL